jgi:cell division protein FtsW (lipid II flippase)
VFPFLLCLPFYLRGKAKRFLRLEYLVMIAGVLMNFTRSAIFGLIAGVLFSFVWYGLKGRLHLISGRILKSTIVITLGVGLVSGGAIQVSSYAKHKMEKFFDREEIVSGESSGYRITAMTAVVEQTMADAKRVLIGNGWGQVYVEIQGEEVQAGGGDLVNVFGYSGVLGVLLYLLYSGLIYREIARVARRSQDPYLALFAEGLLFAFVGMFVTAQMSGLLIAPEYWMLVGIAAFLSLQATARPGPSTA